MSAIEVLKEMKKKYLAKIDRVERAGTLVVDDETMRIWQMKVKSLKEALWALEQKDNQVKWLISCLKTRLDLCKELREKDLDHYNKYIDIEIDFIYSSLERLGLNKSEIRKRVGEQK